jgi:hypothetical protein
MLPKFLAAVLLAHGVGFGLASPIANRAENANSSFTHEVRWSTRVQIAPAFPIHESCNITLQRQLSRALDETVTLAKHAKEHILRWGDESPFVQKYFGNGSTAVPIGWYERVVSADRGAMLFRCDDPDKNCATQDGRLNIPGDT